MKYIVILIFLLLISNVIGEKLEISSVEAVVDGDKDKLSGSDVTVKPGSVLKFSVSIKNSYAEVNNIERITVDAILENILEKGTTDVKLSEEVSKIKNGREEEIEFRFEIPFEVDAGEYSLIIEAEGDDDNGTNHKFSEEYGVVVEKEEHTLEFSTTELNKKTACDETIELDIGLRNLGLSNENVDLEIISTLLQIDEKTNFNLNNDPYDAGNKIRKTFELKIPKTKAAEYPIKIRAKYSSRIEEESVRIKVNCVEEPKPVLINEIIKPTITKPSTIKQPSTQIKTSIEPQTKYNNSEIKGTIVLNKFNITSILLIAFEVLIGITLLLLIFKRIKK